MSSTDALNVKVFADGADLAAVRKLADEPIIAGFTTNPTLMRKAGITDYQGFAREFLEIVPDRPVSFEIFADNDAEMERQALIVASWGPNVYVKIPITKTDGTSTLPLIARLAQQGVQQNITAIMTNAQVEGILPALVDGPATNVSVFAGRIADAGVDPLPIMRETMRQIEPLPNVELIWASPRELLNLVQAHEIGCHIITMTHDLLAKLHLIGKDLDEFSLDTVRMFFNDAEASGYAL
jgi:transaldolase